MFRTFVVATLLICVYLFWSISQEQGKLAAGLTTTKDSLETLRAELKETRGSIIEELITTRDSLDATSIRLNGILERTRRHGEQYDRRMIQDSLERVEDNRIREAIKMKYGIE